MIKWFKSLFNSNPTTMSDADWKVEEQKIVDALMENGEAYIRVNGVLHLLKKQPGFFGKISIEKVDDGL